MSPVGMAKDLMARPKAGVPIGKNRALLEKLLLLEVL